jgi:hypothetical protein
LSCHNAFYCDDKTTEFAFTIYRANLKPAPFRVM